MPIPAKPFTDGTIHELASDTHRSEDEVREIYEGELAAIDADARIKTFVPVFAKRRALERLKARGPGSVRH
ncbi:MAG TPA: DUF3562 domain-containing protein [Polyangiaceae bacterium]|jgi:hypothetical protein|nr:DUF3562 domain-containing protein [Polyangiaceae bacterium]